MYKITIVLITLFILISISGCDNNQEHTDKSQSSLNSTILSDNRILRFCLYASDNPNLELQKYTPLLKYIQEHLNRTGNNIKVKFQGYSNYEKCIESIASGKCDFSRTGPASYILAKKLNPNIRLIAMEHVDKKTTFKGMVVTQTESSIQRINDLKGRAFAFGDKNSTIGRYLSQAALIKHNIYSKDLKNFTYLGRHDLVAKNVINGQYDAGAIKENTFHRYKTKLKIIHEFTNITKPWIASAEIEEKLFFQLQNILITINEEPLLKILKKTGFKPSNDNDYDFVRKDMQLAEEF